MSTCTAQLRWITTLGVLASLGCNGQIDDSVPMTSPAGAASDAQPDIIDEDGSRYVWQRKMPTSGFVQERVLGRADAEQSSTYKRIADMTVEELAAKLRPRRFRNGHEYLLDHDPIELAIKAKANAVGPTEGSNPLGAPVQMGRHDPEPSTIRTDLAPQPTHFIIGSDNRVSYDHAAISWPAMTSLLVEGRHCTATTIGPRTAASAAHCFSDGNNLNQGTGVYLRYASDTAYSAPIPDLSTIYSHYRVTDCAGSNASASSAVTVSIHHTWVKDLVVRLVSPSNRIYVLHDRAAGWLGANDFLWGIYNLNLSNEPASGRWVLIVTDAAGQDVGTLDYWDLALGTPSSCTKTAYRGSGDVPDWTGSELDIDIPDGWNGSDWQFDYARITFPTGTFSQWGWVGTNIAPPGSDRNGQSCNMWGYPDHRPAWNQGRPQTDPNWLYPRLFLKSGAILNYMVFPSALSDRSAYIHDLDIYSGDSGAGLLDLSGRLVGIQSTQWNLAPFGTRFMWNEARAWDATTAAFFTVGGSWP